MSREFEKAELYDRLMEKGHLQNESRRDETGQESATESTSTRASAKRDAEHRSGGKPEEREPHEKVSLENTPSPSGKIIIC